MTKITKTYNINSIQQLIDLNQDSKNFKLTFNCKSHDVNDKYEILVLSQSQLDTEDANNLPFKQVSHTISGDIKADQDIYFMVLGDNVERGLLILSIKRAKQIKNLSNLTKYEETSEIITVRPTEANK